MIKCLIISLFLSSCSTKIDNLGDECAKETGFNKHKCLDLRYGNLNK